jgi:hypothetical protein
VHVHSRGTPRLINTICDNALFEGFVARQREIDDRAVDRVARDLGLEPSTPPAPAAAPGASSGSSNGTSGRPSERPLIDLAEIDSYLESLTK